MNKIRIILMRKKPTMLDFVNSQMSKQARTVFYATLKDANRDQAKVLKQAEKLSKKDKRVEVVKK